MSKEKYRKNVGMILTKDKKRVLLARRMRQKSAWQFPQGGIDKGETAEEALYRELHEELGLTKKDVRVIAESKQWLSYEIPKQFRRRSEKDVCTGQTQKWFLLELLTDESNIRLDLAEHQEFDDWQWVDYWVPLEKVIEFKRDVYEKALEEFSSLMNL